MQIETITCPQCSKEQSVPVHSSLNVTLDPALRGKLFAGQINSFHCSSCGYEATVEAPLLYHDMKRRLAVQYYPPSSLEDADFCARFETESISKHDDMDLPSTEKMPRYLYFPHIVFNLGEMMRYCIQREIVREERMIGSVRHRRSENPEPSLYVS